MADVYVYADETGDLDLTGSKGSSTYFGIGTATLTGEHGGHIWDAVSLRFKLEQLGIRRGRGFHAVDDTRHTRHEVYALLRKQAPRIDVTLLRKGNAYPYVAARGQMHIYKMAWYLHFKHVVFQVSSPGDTVYVIAATLGTTKRKTAAWSALHDVCIVQGPADREIVLCQWDSASSWGLQLADYALWSVQRNVEQGDDTWMPYVQPTLGSVFKPWG